MILLEENIIITLKGVIKNKPSGNYYFYIRDHLGNNRLVIDAVASVVQSNHYYPFGMSFAESTNQEKQPYKYNNKELDDRAGLNWYDYSVE